MNCGICGRLLDHPNDPLSLDCGGDCTACMIEIEAGHGDWQGVIQHAERIKAFAKSRLTED